MLILGERERERVYEPLLAEDFSPERGEFFIHSHTQPYAIYPIIILCYSAQYLRSRTHDSRAQLLRPSRFRYHKDSHL